jgi:hypothetical protein
MCETGKVIIRDERVTHELEATVYGIDKTKNVDITHLINTLLLSIQSSPRHETIVNARKGSIASV